MNSFKVFNRALTYNRLSRPIVNNIIQKRHNSGFNTDELQKGIWLGLLIGTVFHNIYVSVRYYILDKKQKQSLNEHLVQRCKNGDYIGARIYLSHGADPNNKEAMEAAHQNGNLDIIELLECARNGLNLPEK